MKHSAVIGLGFGDEGKGLFTDYLSRENKNSLVVRFCGGQQAGHTVVNENFRHVFSNFGSGSYQGLPSYFSKFCTISPIGIINELSLLKEKKINPTLYIDRSTPITTPYDVIHNRKNTLNGTCGVGFGSTLEREENFFSLHFGDLFFKSVFIQKLNSIREYYGNLELTLDTFLESCTMILQNPDIRISDGIPREYTRLIFEGAQGLMLDKNIGFFPHVTRSNTGSKNISELISPEEVSFYLVTRAYQTRHGKGPLTNESIPHNIKENPRETNKMNDFQGKFRRGILDVGLLEYAISRDEILRTRKDLKLVITCLDQIESEYRFTYNNKIEYSKNEDEFVRKIAKILEIKELFLSHSESSGEIEYIGL